MKKYLGIIMAAGIMATTACDKRLDLKDPQALDATLAYATDAKVKQVLVGAYAEAGTGSLFGGDLLWMSELQGSDGEVRWVGTFPDPRMIWGKSMLVNNSNAFATWASHYRTLLLLNSVLANLDPVKPADKASVEGEAKFLRAMLYFEMVKFFGEKPYSAGNTSALKGVPLLTLPADPDPTSPANQLPRNSVEEVYVQVIKDFSDAYNLLPARNGFYANKGAAALGLARVYLQQGKYAEARDAANNCIATATSNGFSLVAAYTGVFNNSVNTTEDLFSMQVNTQTGTNSCFSYFSTGTYGARDGDIEILDKHMAKYETGDVRKNLFFFEAGAFRCGKWRDIYKNVKVMRLAEAYLTRAECNARLGTSTGASVADDLHRTRNRAGLPRIDAPTLAQVLAERELEIAFEGQAAWDAKRLKQSIDGLAFDDPKLAFPIPQRELNVNPNLVQNPGYN
jgi:tetratricopeptide (TPR) repeat protein